ncbi:MAG TPA: Hint domain-containing protein, partial [Ramlibacter sp.]|nr:Hint domain-containing protein [Ramlibacter sp.]
RSWCAAKCAVCASPDTPIATPGGDRPIADLQVGDLVYTVEGDAILAVPILRVSRTPVANHHVVRVQAADGRVLELSPGHPTADGRTFGDLRPGTRLDGAAIASVELVPYHYPYTYDILPMSRSGTYFAAGMLIGTTLK